MKKRFFLLLFLLLLLTGCSEKKQVYQVVYLDVFDTVTTLRGYETSEEAFHQRAEQVHRELLEYHRLFDIYRQSPGGIAEINQQAGLSPAAADKRVMELLEDCKKYYDLTGGKVNIAMGSVLHLWHEAREAGMADPEHAQLPDMNALQEAAKHVSFDTVHIDTAAGTVFLEDAAQSLDVGAIAKGWTAQKVSAMLPEGYLLNLGGNVCAVGAKPDGSRWMIGVQHPDNSAQYLATLPLESISTVTSGDYERFYTVDGKRYHHIIDPETLMPSTYWRSVTILSPDSGLADCLSTALFLMPLEEGTALAQQCGAEVMWMDGNGDIYKTKGFAK